MAEAGGTGAEADASTAEKKLPGKDVISAADREAARQTFVTGLGVQNEPKQSRSRARDHHKFHVLQSSIAGPRINEHHKDLTDLALTLDQRMEALLMEHEKDFFLAYKTHMYGVQKDIKTLRMKADHEDAKTREDTKIRALEGELDWFMTEALRLDELCKGYKKEVDKWKDRAEALDEDRRFLEDQIKGAKRQNKILRAAAERARSSAYSALMVTKAKSEERTASPSQLALTAPSPTEVPRRPASAGASNKAAKGRTLETRSKTPEHQLATMPMSTSASALPAGAGAAAARSGAAGTLATVRTSGSSASLPMGGSSVSRHAVLGNEAEERYVEAIQHLKEAIVREQHNIRMLQAGRATAYSKKSELEEFFLKCVDEARRELMRKRHLTMHREKSERERVMEAMLTNEDVLVCLYEKLFPHRTGIARSLGGGNDVNDTRALAALDGDVEMD
mmetsp:Transcript_81336/g.149084  ORF Transcript_81336/g.149084 Transcript_81336/m.149084 type:complete len:450 (-) Transcript_81336:33-1382(-)